MILSYLARRDSRGPVFGYIYPLYVTVCCLTNNDQIWYSVPCMGAYTYSQPKRKKKILHRHQVRCVGPHPLLALSAGEGETQLNQYITQIGRINSQRL